MNQNEKLRQDRLIFYSSEIERIETVLRELVSLSSAKCALLIDKEGHMVARTGDTGAFNLDTISALVAGSFAATREMARLLGEQEFSVMFHQGAEDNIQLNLVGDRTILTVIFDGNTTIGMVRLYANEASSKLGEIFTEIESSPRDEEEVNLSESYEADGKARLDSLFT